MFIKNKARGRGSEEKRNSSRITLGLIERVEKVCLWGNKEFEQEGVEDDGILEEDIEPNQNILQNLAVAQGNAQSGCLDTTDVIGDQSRQ
ncbi:hypothetical protein CEXT_51701 [Caerostris extrusa]|uniref:Uncharacterized protein n=1 Tax=Caerostris extrusa TaxID=172846 RepID=A0AAV4QBR6_CAEEX|nr:hypothetical protein CEXT_51701 [Caerostris extrusa]